MKSQKWQLQDFYILQNWFHVKSECRQILKFPHWRCIHVFKLTCIVKSNLLVILTYPKCRKNSLKRQKIRKNFKIFKSASFSKKTENRTVDYFVKSKQVMKRFIEFHSFSRKIWTFLQFIRQNEFRRDRLTKNSVHFTKMNWFHKKFE